MGVIDVSYDLFLASWSSTEFSTQMLQEEKRFCDLIANNKPSPATRFILFPDEAFDRYGAAAAIVRPDSINQVKGMNTAGVIVPVVIVCANYQLTGSTKIYQTRTLYEVFRSDNRTRFFDVGHGIPASQIFMQRDNNADDAY